MQTRAEAALEQAVEQTAGLAWPSGKVQPLNPSQHTRDSTARIVHQQTGAHWTTRNWINPAPSFPNGGAAGGAIVWWNPSTLTPFSTQPLVCKNLLLAKATGQHPHISPYWSPSFLLKDGNAYLLDGHHALVLATIAVKRGLLDGPLPAYVHLATPYGSTGQPRLDCDCPRANKLQAHRSYTASAPRTQPGAIMTSSTSRKETHA